jgi:hypothetical protein
LLVRATMNLVRNTVGDAKFISIMTAGFVCPVKWY